MTPTKYNQRINLRGWKDLDHEEQQAIIAHFNILLDTLSELEKDAIYIVIDRKIKV